MTPFDSMTPTETAIDSSPSALSTPNRDEIEGVNTLLLRTDSTPTKPETALRDSAERHDGEMRPPATMLDAQFKHSTGPSSNERVRSGTGRSSR